jgi:hypothetical protein
MAREVDCLDLRPLKAANAEYGADGEARGAPQHGMLRHHKVLEHRHAGEQPDVLEGAGDARLGIDLVVRKLLELVGRAARLAPWFRWHRSRPDQRGDVLYNVERHVVDGGESLSARSSST